ncbi:MAG: YdcF family protein [Rhodospirillales bacterium]|nr:YdcF family protein [Rhodospirillales bacterium]
MFELSKIGWTLVNPTALAFLVLLAGAPLLWTRYRNLGRGLVMLALVASVGVQIVPVGKWLLHSLEGRFPVPREMPAKVDGIIMLGGEIDQFRTLSRGQPALYGGASRLIAFAALAKHYPDARLVFTGGSGQMLRQEQSEAEAMRIVFAMVGLDPNRVTFEDRSRNTYENAILTFRLVEPPPEETWLLVTSARHMPRSMGVFRRAGWKIVAYPVDFLTEATLRWRFALSFDNGLGKLETGLREWTGLVVYYLLGHTDALFPAP